MDNKIVNSLEEFKAELQKVLDKEGFTEFCTKCPIERCCKVLVPTCDFVIENKNCNKDKRFGCYFYICPVLNKKNVSVSNWLQRVQESYLWPNKLEFPFKLEKYEQRGSK